MSSPSTFHPRFALVTRLPRPPSAPADKCCTAHSCSQACAIVRCKHSRIYATTLPRTYNEKCSRNLGIQEVGDSEVTTGIAAPCSQEAHETAQTATIKRTILGGIYWLYNAASFRHLCRLCWSIVRSSGDRAVLGQSTIQRRSALGWLPVC